MGKIMHIMHFIQIVLQICTFVIVPSCLILPTMILRRNNHDKAFDDAAAVAGGD